MNMLLWSLVLWLVGNTISITTCVYIYVYIYIHIIHVYMRVLFYCTSLRNSTTTLDGVMTLVQQLRCVSTIVKAICIAGLSSEYACVNTCATIIYDIWLIPYTIAWRHHHKVGWHYLSNATCLMRPPWLYVCFVVSRIMLICRMLRQCWRTHALDK